MLKKCTLFVVLLVPSVCFAWGVEGHQIVAEIASRHLDAKARAAVKSILGGESMVDVCTWADEIRKEPKYIFTDGCHGVTIPPGAKKFKMKRDCANGRCAPAAIEKYAAILKDPKTKPADRLDALKFVIHFVGDIHCPVHASYPHGKGGVAVDVTFFGQPTILHKVWDKWIIERVNKPWQRYAAELDRAITSKQRDEWSGTMDPVDWANETFQVALKYVNVSPEHNQIGEDYFKRGVPVINKRLSMAGIRLATILNGILGEAKSATSRPAAKSH